MTAHTSLFYAAASSGQLANSVFGTQPPSQQPVKEVVSFLPAEKSPTVSRLADSAWVAVEVILEEKQERELIPRLKRAGATGIITYPLNKVIP